MGTTNLLAGLKHQYATLSGELADIDTRIERIRAEYAKIGEMEARIEVVKEGIKNVVGVIRLIQPEWDEASVQPRKLHSRQIPLRPGESARMTLDVLREAREPMRARDIATRVLAKAGILEPDTALLQRSANTVTASLRQHQGKLVQADNQWSKRWSIIATE